MKRRTLIAASLATLPASRAFAAERKIGWVSPESREATVPFFNAFQTALQETLRPTGDTVRIYERYVTGGPDGFKAAVAELEELGVSLIVSQGAATPPVVGAKPKVPVVFGYSGDPIAAGFAQSLPRPGGNATGVTFMSIELMPKRIDLLRAALPQCRKVALFSNARHPGEENEVVACRRVVEPAGIELSVHRVLSGTGVTPAVAEALDAGAQALIVLPSAVMVQQSPAIVAQCLVRKVPVVSGWASIARAGGLLTYGPNLQDAYKRIAHYVVRVLAGASPANLPIEQPTKFELVINTKTAAALGLKLPPTLLAQADEIIE
jgi:putative tryptophan/tyrosine transport system substrate-binding protein